MRELPRDLTWSRAPDWANVLLDGWCGRNEEPDNGDPSRYSWAASKETDAKRQYTGGAKIVGRVEKSDLYRLVAVRPAH